MEQFLSFMVFLSLLMVAMFVFYYMEQFLSFMVFLSLLMVAMFVFYSPSLYLLIFLGGVTYLMLRGKKKGWAWPKRP